MTDQILLNGMEFYGHHGCSEEEQRRGQKFIVDATLELDLSTAGLSDHIEHTIDYVKVLEVIRSIVEGPPRKLLEAVAEEIARTLLAQFAPLQSLTITIRKPEPPVEITFAGAAVSLTRRRHA